MGGKMPCKLKRRRSKYEKSTDHHAGITPVKREGKGSLDKSSGVSVTLRKSKVRSNKHLSEIQKHSCLANTDSGRNPNSIFLMRKGKWYL